MTNDELVKQRDELRRALASLLRVTADPDPLHPSWRKARQEAAAVYQRTNLGP